MYTSEWMYMYIIKNTVCLLYSKENYFKRYLPKLLTHSIFYTYIARIGCSMAGQSALLADNYFRTAGYAHVVAAIRFGKL